MKLTRTITVTQVVRKRITVGRCPHCGKRLNSNMADARESVWTAMADLFLDTDVRIWYVHTARVLAESPFSLIELREILDTEVTPALQGNLLDIAGEWGGFDNDWVVKEVRANLGKGHALLVNMDRTWAALAQLVESLRQLPAAEILARTKAWDALIPLFLYKRTERKSVPAQYSMPELERFFRRDLWPALIEGVRRLARDHPSQYPTEAEVEANWTKFLSDSAR